MSKLKQAINKIVNILTTFTVIALFSLLLTGASSTVSPSHAALSETKSYSVSYAKDYIRQNATKRFVQVAFTGFFDPYSTIDSSSPKKKYDKKQAAKKKKITPQYNLGFNNAKGHFKTYKYNSNEYAPQFDDLDQDLIKQKYLRTNKNLGGYRTMCVRLKDGYYWPINFSRTKADLKRDQIKCQNSCSGKVRLFYYRNTSDDLASMRDLKGKRYSSLKTAFLYRKKYLKDASCKPKPWSAEAKAVHKKYAVLDAKKKRRMHMAQAKRAENLRVAALTSKRKYRKLRAKYARTLNTDIKKARRTRRAKLKRRYSARRKVARLNKTKNYKKKYYKSYSKW